MNRSYTARAVLGAMNLLTIGGSMLANHVVHASNQSQQIETLNVASLGSIESTWLDVPPACKARGFNASPVALENKAANANVQSIYSNYGA